MTYLALLSSVKGRRAGFSLVAGITAGLLVVGLVAAFGMAELITSNPVIYSALRWSGIAYMVWLAWDNWHETDVVPGDADEFRLQYFRHGLVTNILNPKAVLFYITVLPLFVDAESAALRQTLLLTLLYVSIATIIHVVIALLGSQLTPLLRAPKQIILTRRVFSILLLFIALWLAWLTQLS